MKNLYHNYILKYSKYILSLMAVFIIAMGFSALKLEVDASAETLLLEGDKDLEFTREIAKRFEAPNILVVTYTIKDEDYLLSEENIQNIKTLSQELRGVNIVESINSLVNVPLLQCPPRPIKELVKNVPTLESEGIDKKLVEEELLSSAIYKMNLVSEDFKTTALSVNLKRDNQYFDLINNRDSFLKLKKDRELSDDEKLAFEEAERELKEYRDIIREDNHLAIVRIREILKDFGDKNPDIKLHLGGVDMIADDMVEFVKYDLRTFGFVIVTLLIMILYILLKEKRWVVIALFICTASLVVTSGLLGLFGWEITVVSSNFISLQLIMNMSLIVHLIVKYKELHAKNKNDTQEQLVLDTVVAMSKPSFFVVITTIAGFSSLVFSNILPVINFGWMMSVGIVVSLIMTYILFPITLMFFNKSEWKDDDPKDVPFTTRVAGVAFHYRKSILAMTFLIVIFSITGSTKLIVENSFIDYFKKETQIYQGMALIDQKLGGTTPLDVVLTFKEGSDSIESVDVIQNEEEDELDEFAEEFEESESDKEKYWFTQAKMQKITQVHNYLDSLEPVGKVVSLATVGEIIKVLNEGKEADSLMLALLYKELPERHRKVVISPYMDVENNQVRITTRIIDSMPDLKRSELLKKIKRDLSGMLNPKYQEYRLSNILVMYDNMLQSLFTSQIKTIGIVVFILFVMFLLVFRDFKIAVIAIIANTIPVSVIFGFLGWMEIPLDLMTITIAAISIGIAVDDTIHYVHRFTLEHRTHSDSKEAIYNSHASIGTAMFYTSTIIMVGFSVLVLSNFIPTIYFGLLTMLAMFMAIVADLLLLPVLLLMFGV